MGASNGKMTGNDDTINWNNIKTDDISSSLPQIYGISNEAKQLVARLNLENISNSESDSEYNITNIIGGDDKEISNESINSTVKVMSPFFSEAMVNELRNNSYNNLIGGNNSKQINYNKPSEEINNEPSEENYSEQFIGGSDNRENTENSLFISSDIYNNMLNNFINMNGGNIDDDDDTSSTSSLSTSSSESSSSKSEDLEDKKKKSKKQKKNVKKTTESSVYKSSDKKFSEDSVGGSSKRKSKKISTKYTEQHLSYVSSSAHTENNSESIQNDNNYNISTVNTSDINMISD